MIVKPDCYDKVACIAKECDCTCCQEWKIAVDDDTADKWKQTPTPAGTKSRRTKLEQYTKSNDGTRDLTPEDQVSTVRTQEK